MSQLAPLNRGNAPADSVWLELVRQQVGSLRYGVVQIVVHDGHVAQIEKTERVRLDSRSGAIGPTDKHTPASGASGF